MLYKDAVLRFFVTLQSELHCISSVFSRVFSFVRTLIIHKVPSSKETDYVFGIHRIGYYAVLQVKVPVGNLKSSVTSISTNLLVATPLEGYS